MATSGAFFCPRRDSTTSFECSISFKTCRLTQPQNLVPKKVSQGEMMVAIFVGFERQILALRTDKPRGLKKSELSS